MNQAIANFLLFLSLTFTVQAQWIKLPLPGTPRTKDGKPNLTAPAPRATDGHPDLTGIWISSRQYTNPNGRGLERYMPPGSKVPMLPGAAKFYAEITAHGDAADPSERCLPDGVPNHMIPLPIKIVQTPAVILTLYEEFAVFRQIFTDGRKLMADESDAREAVKLAIDLGSDVNAANQAGNTALYSSKQELATLAKWHKPPPGGGAILS